MRLPAVALASALVTASAMFATGSLPASAQAHTHKANHVAVKKGDTLSGIAADHQTTYVRLFDANTKIADPDLIYPGQTIRIPDVGEKLAHRAIPSNAPAPTPAPVAAPVHHVAPVVRPVYQAPKPQPRPQTVSYTPAPAVSSGSVWDRIAACESSGNWGINTGNGFYGGLQFTLPSWRAVGGNGLPNQASRDEQIMRAQKLQAMQGWGAWPVCSLKAGMSY